jgi:hypothetical protein
LTLPTPVDLCQIVFCLSDEDVAPELPVDPVISEFMAAFAFGNPTPVIRANDEDVVTDAHEDLVFPRNSLLQDRNHLLKAI